ncbi:MAG: hypothetical protein IKI97_13245 [Clostridia bacterium]|nr:hypothetical protein [Clostridia bacterium]
MEKYNYMFKTAEKTLAHTAFNIKGKKFDNHSVLSSYRVSENICTDDKRAVHISSRLMKILCRSKALYFGILTSYGLLETVENSDCREYFDLCCNLSVRALLLFGFLPDRKMYDFLKNHIIADTQDALCAASYLRFSTLETFGKIFLALPQLEFIYSCNTALSRILRLCSSYDSVNNIFTLCT